MLDLDKNIEEPFIVTYRSRPIQGIQLELVKVNPKYGDKETKHETKHETKYGENGTTTEER